MKPCKSYSFSYSLEIYRVFRKKYPRATEIFQIITKCRYDYPVWLFAHNQPKWNRFKRIVKLIEKMDLDAQPIPITKHLCSYIEDELMEKGCFIGYEGLDKLSRKLEA